jgi:uncharacterized membrane protein
MNIPIPGLGFAVTIAFITLIGVLTSNYLGNKLFILIDKLFSRLPLVKLLYSAIKDVIGAFAGDKKSFDKPVIVELVENGPKALGFITSQSLDFLSLDNHVSVYLPQSYNFAGSVLLFPCDRVKPVDVDSSEAMAFIVSGGISGKENGD